MTADQVKGKGFGGALRYNLQKVDHGMATILKSTFTPGNERSILREVALVKVLRPNLQKYFYHTSLNFPVQENLTDQQMTTIAGEYLSGMGFDQHQHIIFRHFDADHPHLHILVNRIGYDGSVVSDSKDYQRSEQVLRRLEKEHRLTEVISSKQAKERAMTKNELEMMKRTDEPSIKMKLQVILKQVLGEQPNITGFITRLEEKGINVLFNQANTGFVSGISYGYEGMQFKGAHLGNAYKWQAVKTAISYEQERDRAAVRQTNDRTRAKQSVNRLNGADGNTKIAAGDRKAVHQGAGKLQEQIGKAGGRSAAEAQNDRIYGQRSGLSGAGDRGQRGKGASFRQKDLSPLAGQVIPDRGLIRDLLGTDHHDPDLAAMEMTPYKKRRKKKKQGHSQ